MARRKLTKAEIAEFDPIPSTKREQLQMHLAELRGDGQKEIQADRDQLERQLLKIRGELTRCSQDLESCKEAIWIVHEDCKQQLKDKDAHLAEVLSRGGARTKRRRRGGRTKRRRRGGRTRKRRRVGRIKRLRKGTPTKRRRRGGRRR